MLRIIRASARIPFILSVSAAALSMAVPTTAHADVEIVTLDDGTTYEVETDDGLPIAAQNRQVEILFLHLEVRVSPDSGDLVWRWAWSARLKRRGNYAVTLTTPIDEAVSTSFIASGRGDVSHHFFSSDEYPTLWGWLDKPGTIWLPWVFSFEDRESDDAFELTQWVRYDAAVIARLREAVLRLDSDSQAQRTPEPRPADSPEETALIYIFRDGLGSRNALGVFMDEAPVASLPRLSYTTTAIPPGWHVVWGDVMTGWFEFQAGRTYLLGIFVDTVSGAVRLAPADPRGTRRVISNLGLQQLVLTTESAAEMREELDRYPRIRRRAGDPPDEPYPMEFKNVVYRSESPGVGAQLLNLGQRGTLALDEAQLTYQSGDERLDVPIGALIGAGLSGSRLDWVAVTYREQGAVRQAYFGGLGISDSSATRIVLLLQNAIPGE